MNLTVARRYQAAHAALQDRVARALQVVWAAQPALTDAQLAQFLNTAVPLVTASQTAAIGLAGSYIGAYTGQQIALDAEKLRSQLRGGILLLDVYSRPTISLRTMLGIDVPYADAVQAVAARLDSTARTDMQLAGRAGAHAAMEAAHVVGYRRVCSGTPCLLCLAAATQRYHARDLMPIHPRCSCTVAPIIGHEDPGHIIDRDLLEQLKSADYLGQLRGDHTTPSLDTLRDQYAVRHHGEFGPVLTVPGQHFDGPAELAA